MIPALLGTLAYYGVKKVVEHLFAEELLEEAGYSGRYRVRRSLRLTRAYLEQYLVQHRRCFLLERKPASDLFLRGDARLTRLPPEQDISWFDVPVSIYLHYSLEGPLCLADFQLRTVPGAKLTSSFAQFARTEAKRDFDLGLECLKLCCAEDEGGALFSEPDEHAADYALLGLKPGAPWPAVQSAYRDASLKYHPDTLANVPPHLIALSSERFKQVTEAYQRLKQKLAR